MQPKSIEIRNYELDNLAWQLSNYHGVELSNNQIWFAIYNDAGRDICRAEDMLHDILDDAAALNRFAQSLYSIELRRAVSRPGYPTDALIVVSCLAFAIGYIAGCFA